ncbi:MAG: hypothetical protein WCJ25_02065 [Candidatus Moraniibacteriota bacterium]
MNESETRAEHIVRTSRRAKTKKLADPEVLKTMGGEDIVGRFLDELYYG